jgi:hypothetical protein
VIWLNNLMTQKTIAAGLVHKVPSDMEKALTSDAQVLAKWDSLTPIQRNEWICWVTFVKKDKTREEHIKRAISELKEGMRRPCCWLGCPHRKDKPMSPSQKFVLGRLSKRVS